MIDYKEWLDDTYGIKPHRSKHEDSFNNIIFSSHLLIGRLVNKTATHEDIDIFMQHVHLNKDEFGLYKPKNSHDNVTALIAGLNILESGKVNDISLHEANRSKHPRDRIIYSFILENKLWAKLLMPFAMFDIVRGILNNGKTRPAITQSYYTMLRLKIALGLLKPVRTGLTFGGIEKFYMYKGKEERVIQVQNDGKHLNLLRLNMLKDYWYLKPFVRFCKKLYIKKMGSNFQSVIFGNYFEEEDHPVRVVYRKLDEAGITVLDC